MHFVLQLAENTVLNSWSPKEFFLSSRINFKLCNSGKISFLSPFVTFSSLWILARFSHWILVWSLERYPRYVPAHRKSVGVGMNLRSKSRQSSHHISLTGLGEKAHHGADWAKSRMRGFCWSQSILASTINSSPIPEMKPQANHMVTSGQCGVPQNETQKGVKEL